MAAEDIGTIYPTKIPGLEDPADIQAALKLYHYGTTDAITTEGGIISNSVVGHIKALDTRIDSIESTGIGSGLKNAMPTSVPDGYIWVDSTSSPASEIRYAVSQYTTAQPSSPSVGTLWVDSDSSPLTMYVWSGTAWREIGA